MVTESQQRVYVIAPYNVST